MAAARIDVSIMNALRTLPSPIQREALAHSQAVLTLAMTGKHTGGLQLSEVVPWGRTLHEYLRMFMLTPADLRGRILDVGGGPASFNAELTARGGRVLSADPLYQFRAAEIARRIDEVRPGIIQGLARNMGLYHWDEFASAEAVGERRMDAMRRFLTDYQSADAAERYLPRALPALGVATGSFDLALCSHLLFTYSDVLGAAMHAASVRELLRVAREVRIFPLVNVDGRPSAHLAPMIAEARAAGHTAEVVPVNYRFQRGAEEMLVLRRRD